MVSGIFVVCVYGCVGHGLLRCPHSLTFTRIVGRDSPRATVSMSWVVCRTVVARWVAHVRETRPETSRPRCEHVTSCFSHVLCRGERCRRRGDVRTLREDTPKTRLDTPSASLEARAGGVWRRPGRRTIGPRYRTRAARIAYSAPRRASGPMAYGRDRAVSRPVRHARSRQCWRGDV